MSWDISICKFSRNYERMEDIPDDERTLPIGEASIVRNAISKHFPKTNWSDPAWGVFDAPFGSIEFNIGPGQQPLGGFMLHVRAGEEVVPPIVELCLAEGWQALDCGTGEFLEKVRVPEAGLHKWLQYRNHVLGAGSA
jgi:hypothetical protein